MTKKVKGDIIINKIEIRCKGFFDSGRSCHHMFYVGSPGFDLHGNPKEQIVKCDKCGTYNSVTSIVEERVIVKSLGKEYRRAP